MDLDTDRNERQTVQNLSCRVAAADRRCRHQKGRTVPKSCANGTMSNLTVSPGLARTAFIKVNETSTRCRKLADGTYEVATAAGRRFLLTKRDGKKFKGYCDNRYAHETSPAALEAYHAHCIDRGLPFVSVLRWSADFAKVSVELPAGQEFSHEGRFAAFVALARGGRKGKPKIGQKAARYRKVDPHSAGDVAKASYMVARNSQYVVPSSGQPAAPDCVSDEDRAETEAI
jgi:hypothetical protein